MERKEQQSLNEAIKDVVEGGISYDFSPLTRELFGMSVTFNRILADDAYKILPTKQMNKIKSIRKELLSLVKEIDKL